MYSQCIGSVGYFINSQRLIMSAITMNFQRTTSVDHYREFPTHYKRRQLLWIPKALLVSANTTNSQHTASVGFYFADAGSALASVGKYGFWIRKIEFYTSAHLFVDVLADAAVRCELYRTCRSS